MNNNDIIRRIRYNLDLNDDKMVELFSLVDVKVNKPQVINWLKNEDDPTHVIIDDINLANFLNGLIVDKRGKLNGQTPTPERRLNNNIVLRKLKIALNLKDSDILTMLSLVGKNISKHELSAFFRNPKQSQYRVCQDQILRNFLHGMQIRYRGK